MLRKFIRIADTIWREVDFDSHHQNDVANIIRAYHHNELTGEEILIAIKGDFSPYTTAFAQNSRSTVQFTESF